MAPNQFRLDELLVLEGSKLLFPVPGECGGGRGDGGQLGGGAQAV